MVETATAFVARILERYVRTGTMLVLVAAFIVAAALLALADVAGSPASSTGTIPMAPWRW
jgi:hypothetical protein